MAKIKIEDLPILESLTNEEVKEIFGGDGTYAYAPGTTQLPGSGTTQLPGSGTTQLPGSGTTQTPTGGSTLLPGSGTTYTSTQP